MYRYADHVMVAKDITFQNSLSFHRRFPDKNNISHTKYIKNVLELHRWVLVEEHSDKKSILTQHLVWVWLKSRLPRVNNTSQFYHCILTQHLMGALVVAKVVYPGYFSLRSQFITRSSQFITEYSWAMTYSAHQEHGKKRGKTEFATGLEVSLSLSWPSTMTVQGILTEWAILTELLAFLTQERWARIRSDYPANIWKV